MFHSLIKMFHDGIMLTEEDKVVFANISLEKIFELQREHKDFESHQGDLNSNEKYRE